MCCLRMKAWMFLPFPQLSDPDTSGKTAADAACCQLLPENICSEQSGMYALH